jgi:hypothetical protein
MAAWLKTFREGNPLSHINDPADLPAIDGEDVFLEPLSFNPDGTPRLTKHGEPLGKPSWEPGHLIGAYWGGTYSVNAVWVVMDTPEESQLDDWAWETPVRLIAKDKSVTIKQLGVRPQSLMRRVRLRLRPEQEKILRGAFQL